MNFKEKFANQLGKIDLFLGENDLDLILKLYNKNTYFQTVNNIIYTIDDVKDDVYTIPPITTKENKYYFSIYDINNQLIGVIDLIDGYISNSTEKNGIWIGLLEINNDLHRLGYGRKIVDCVKAMLIEYKVIQIGVLINNEIGLSFWYKNGFKFVKQMSNDFYLLEYKND